MKDLDKIKNSIIKQMIKNLNDHSKEVLEKLQKKRDDNRYDARMLKIIK